MFLFLCMVDLLQINNTVFSVNIMIFYITHLFFVFRNKNSGHRYETSCHSVMVFSFRIFDGPQTSYPGEGTWMTYSAFGKILLLTICTLFTTHFYRWQTRYYDAACEGPVHYIRQVASGGYTAESPDRLTDYSVIPRLRNFCWCCCTWTCPGQTQKYNSRVKYKEIISIVTLFLNVKHILGTPCLFMCIFIKDIGLFLLCDWSVTSHMTLVCY